MHLRLTEFTEWKTQHSRQNRLSDFMYSDSDSGKKCQWGCQVVSRKEQDNRINKGQSKGAVRMQLCSPDNLIMICVMLGNDVISPRIGLSPDIIWWNWNCQLLPGSWWTRPTTYSRLIKVCVREREGEGELELSILVTWNVYKYSEVPKAADFVEGFIENLKNSVNVFRV